MARHQVDAFIVPSADPHLSEYLPGRWKGREWLSGFTGSVGTFIATRDFAGVWTDGRYYTQAEQELAGTEIRLMKIPSGASLLHIDWLADNMDEGQTVAVDARVLGLAVARLL
jgi:Xaa-Pro aminopeptidase